MLDSRQYTGLHFVSYLFRLLLNRLQAKLCIIYVLVDNDTSQIMLAN